MNPLLELKKLPSELFHKYRSKKALVYHPNSMTRSAITNTLSSIGLTSQNVSILSGTFEDVKKNLYEIKPEVIICSTEIETQSFVEILNIHEEIYPGRLNCLMCVIGKDGSLSSGSILLGHFIDAYIATPLSAQILTNTLVDQIILKASANEQSKTFDQARKEFIKKNYKQSKDLFVKLIGFKSTAPLAYHFLGQILEKDNNPIEALKFYTTGIKLANPSYLCLQSCLNLLVKEKQFEKAHDVSALLLEKYPFNPNDIYALLQIFVATQKHNEIIKLISIFKNAQSVDTKLKNYLSAGLVIGAKLLFKQSDPVNAISALEHACFLSSTNEKVLEQSCILLAEFEYKDDAFKLLEKYSGPKMHKEIFLRIQLEIYDKSKDYQSMIKLGQDLLKIESSNLRNFELFLNAAKMLKIPNRTISSFTEIIKNKFPDKSQDFLQKYGL